MRTAAKKLSHLIFALCAAAVGQAFAAEVTLQVVRYPERDDIKIEMLASRLIPSASMSYKGEFDEGQTRIELKHQRMKPAVLFGGDTTCYVLWAINRDGGSENLGELVVRTDSNQDTIIFRTGLRTFGLMVTAEPYSQKANPSDSIIFLSGPSNDPRAPSTRVTFSEFGLAPETRLESLANVRYDGDTPLDIVQAERTLRIADRMGAQEYSAQIYREAELTLSQSRQMARGSKRGNRSSREYARKSIASSNEAIKVTVRQLEAIALEEEIARRKAEMDGLQAQVDSARRQRQQAEQARSDAEEESRRLSADKQRLEQERDLLERQKAQTEESVRRSQAELSQIREEKRAVESQKQQLGAALVDLRREREQLRESMNSLRQEKSLLQSRLQGALSKVAETQDSARGLIVNLPDILFDVNQATLKNDAKIVIGKMAGIMLIMQDFNLRIEGHTDSTGSAAHNMRLSQQRADSVFDFLAENGIASTRMKSVGYGMDRPIGENSSADGRRRNRRVEIIIAEGEVAEAAGSEQP